MGEKNPQIAQIVAGRPGYERVSQSRKEIVGIAAAKKIRRIEVC